MFSVATRNFWGPLKGRAELIEGPIGKIPINRYGGFKEIKVFQQKEEFCLVVT